MDPILDKENIIQVSTYSMDSLPSWSPLSSKYECNKTSFTSAGTQSPSKASSRPTSNCTSPIRPTSRTNTPQVFVKSPLKYTTPGSHTSDQPNNETALSEQVKALHDEFTTLRNQYVEILLAKNSLENTLRIKDAELKELHQSVSQLESTLKFVRHEYDIERSKLLHENGAYQQAVEELTLTVSKMASKIKSLEELHISHGPATSASSSTGNLNGNEQDQIIPTNAQIASDLDQKYVELLKLYRILQSNYELERNAKLALIDELENSSKQSLSTNKFEPLSTMIETQAVDIDFAENTTHTMHQLTSDESDVDSSITNTHGAPTERQHRTRPKESHAAFPQYVLDDYFDVSSRFQTTPAKFKRNSMIPSDIKSNSLAVETRSSDLKSNPARNSMPIRLSLPHFENREFTLSPLRLSSNNGVFEVEQTPRKTPAVARRYSSTKPNHSRYNSHDIFPIMVEFEAVTPETLRKSSLQENHRTSARKTLARNLLCHHQEEDENVKSVLEEHDLFSADASRAEVRTDAFNALSGLPTQNPLDNTFSTSLARLSILTEHESPGLLRSHQITKLKFELQSLKLHNEKLLSYIGFELQKQNKTIKKLSKKQSIRTLRAAAAATAGVVLDSPSPSAPATGATADMEYSDAVLIELSRDELINKKRVLRLVSINPILSKNYFMNPNRNASHQHQSPDAMQAFASGLPEDFIVGSHNRLSQIGGPCSDDIYGFMNVSNQRQLRRFSKGLDIYTNIEAYTNSIDDTDNGWSGGSSGSDEDNISARSSLIVRKCRSAEFSRSRKDFDALAVDSDDEFEIPQSSIEYSMTSLEEEELGILTQLKHIIVGNDHKKKRKNADPPLVDDGMKLKFLTVTIGIMIIGIQFSHTSSRS